MLMGYRWKLVLVFGSTFAIAAFQNLTILAPRDCPTDWICPKERIYTSKIGAWYEPWWARVETPRPGTYWRAWLDTSRYKPVINGQPRYYDCGIDADIRHEFRAIKSAGIDFLILDDTNTILDETNSNTKPWIQDNISSMFNVDAHLPETQQIPMAVAIGGQLMLNKTNPLEMQNREANFVAAHFVPWGKTYFHWQGRPLLINYNTFSTQNPTEPTWSDVPWRFNVRNAADFVNLANPAYGEHGWWGWTQEYPQPLNSEAMTVSPGANNAHRRFNGQCPHCDYALDRQGGDLFIMQWIRAIKQNPQTIVINSWNEFSDESSIEPAIPDRSDAPPWTDSYGTLTPDWYLQITTGYTSLRTGLRPGYYYRDESNYNIYQVKKGRLIRQPNVLPHGKPVIVLPAHRLDDIVSGKNPY